MENIDTEGENKVTDDLGGISYLCDSCYIDYQIEEQFIKDISEDEE